jgi:hypothetical protein
MDLSPFTILPTGSVALEDQHIRVHNSCFFFVADSVREDWVRGLDPPKLETWFWEAEKGTSLKWVAL